MFSKNQIKPPKPLDEAEANRLEAEIAELRKRSSQELAKLENEMQQLSKLLDSRKKTTPVAISASLCAAVEPIRPRKPKS